MAGREARAKRATTAFTRRESSECTFFSRKLFFFDHHAIQGENPKVSKRPDQLSLSDPFFFKHTATISAINFHFPPLPLSTSPQPWENLIKPMSRIDDALAHRGRTRRQRAAEEFLRAESLREEPDLGCTGEVVWKAAVMVGCVWLWAMSLAAQTDADNHNRPAPITLSFTHPTAHHPVAVCVLPHHLPLVVTLPTCTPCTASCPLTSRSPIEPHINFHYDPFIQNLAITITSRGALASMVVPRVEWVEGGEGEEEEYVPGQLPITDALCDVVGGGWGGGGGWRVKVQGCEVTHTKIVQVVPGKVVGVVLAVFSQDVVRGVVVQEVDDSYWVYT